MVKLTALGGCAAQSLRTYEDPERSIQARQALERIAQRVVLKALDDDLAAITEIGNRWMASPASKSTLKFGRHSTFTGR